MLEWILKIILSAILITAIVVAVGGLRWVWTHQIDAWATVSGIFRDAVEPPGIATRDSNKLYQNGEAVGDVVGDVEESGDGVVFRRLASTGNLDRGEPFQYVRRTLRIVKIRQFTGQLTNLLPSGETENLTNVLYDVECVDAE